MKHARCFLVMILFLFMLSACGPMLAEAGLGFSPVLHATRPNEQGPELRIATLTPTPTPAPTPEPVKLTATVWQAMPRVPILMYHRFDVQPGATSYAYTTSLSDFEGHLSSLYEAGYSLVSLQDWLDGKIDLPPGRRPLIITIDDLFYGDQLSLDENGEPAIYSGVGTLWHFYQNHPDFQFHLSLFYNFGDKQYANTYQNGVFLVTDGWRQARAEAIAWGIEHDAVPANHFYRHPFLNQLSPTQIEWELSENDKALREALALVGKEALAEGLPNILALPYVVWPATEAGKQVLYDYRSPEGVPVAAILEADEATNAKLLPAPFSTDFDRWHVPRINARWGAIDLIRSLKDEISAPEICKLGKFDPSHTERPKRIMEAIQARITNGRCPMGLYMVNDFIFQADSNGVTQISP